MCDKNTYNECINIIEDKNTLNHSELLTKWGNFKNKYPKLYEMLITSQTVDLKLLKLLCNSAEDHNSLTKDEQIENEFSIGDNLAKKYIYDKFPEPSKKQTEFIKETLRKKIKNDTTFNTSQEQEQEQEQE